jgi:hypothetical protein
VVAQAGPVAPRKARVSPIKNLSHLAADSITATSQSAGNMSSSNELAQTAPGSQTVDPAIARESQSDPRLRDTTSYMDSPVEVAADGSDVTRDHADRSNPFVIGDGGWKSTRDPLPETRGKPRIRMGGGWAGRTNIP